MDAASLLPYQPAHSRWQRLGVAIGLLSLLVLLALAVGLLAASQALPVDGQLIAPFRWAPLGPGLA